MDSMHCRLENTCINANLQAHGDQLGTEQQEQICSLEVAYDASLDEYTKTMSKLQQKSICLVVIKNNYSLKVWVLLNKIEATCLFNIWMTHKMSKLTNDISQLQQQLS
jgi:hypothetical protein